jgi:hypothetical protein
MSISSSKKHKLFCQGLLPVIQLTFFIIRLSLAMIPLFYLLMFYIFYFMFLISFFKKRTFHFFFFKKMKFIYTLFGHLLPNPPPLPRTCSTLNLFCPIVVRFCWRENISDNEKNIAFLLVWDKDSFTQRFLALLPCTCVLQPTLVPLY